MLLLLVAAWLMVRPHSCCAWRG